MQEAESRAVRATIRLGAEGVDAEADVSSELRLAKIQHKANAQMIRTLDRMRGSVLDILA